MIIIDIRHRHHNNISIHLHHHSNELFFLNIIWLQTLSYFCYFKHLIVKITSNVMNCNISVAFLRLVMYSIIRIMRWVGLVPTLNTVRY